MPGRPRDPELEQRLLAAAWELLGADGYDALTLTRVAAHAGAHRSDVYRRWSTKARLVADVLAEHLPPVSEPDTGALLSDLQAYVDDIAASWSSTWIDGLMGFLADLRRDPDAELAFVAVAMGRGAVVPRALDRAIARGEISELPDLAVLSDILEGPLMHARLLARRELTADYLRHIADAAYRVATTTRASA